MSNKNKRNELPCSICFKVFYDNEKETAAEQLIKHLKDVHDLDTEKLEANDEQEKDKFNALKHLSALQMKRGAKAPYKIGKVSKEQIATIKQASETNSQGTGLMGMMNQKMMNKPPNITFPEIGEKSSLGLLGSPIKLLYAMAIAIAVVSFIIGSYVTLLIQWVFL